MVWLILPELWHGTCSTVAFFCPFISIYDLYKLITVYDEAFTPHQAHETVPSPVSCAARSRHHTPHIRDCHDFYH